MRPAPPGAGNTRGQGRFRLDVELEVHDIAVLHDVFLTFLPQLSRVLAGTFAAERDIVVEGDRFRADEAALHVGMDLARSIGCLGARVNGPGAGFLRADG